jgi:type II secretory pathway pseudopilin PulG
MGENEKSGRSFETFWEIAIVILIFGFIAAIVIPNMQRPRTSSANACINNLRQIDAAANQFALEQRKTNGEAIHFPDDLTPYIKLNSAGKIPPCPGGGIYSLKKIGDAPTCSLGSTVRPTHILP